MPQGDYIKNHVKKRGRRLDFEEKKRKREAHIAHKRAEYARKLRGIKAKIYNKERREENIRIKRLIRAHEEKKVNRGVGEGIPEGAVPTYLLERGEEKQAKMLCNMVKQKRKDKKERYSVPLPRVRGISEEEVFKVIKSGKSKRKLWKRMITKATFVGEGFTRKPVKYERFIRPMALRQKKANVTHPKLAVTMQFPILSVKKNPQSPMYTQLGVLTKGTIIEVNVSEMGLVTPGGKVVWGKYAQITNNPENDGCVNAVLLV
ncbi:hypothetical protein T552_01302 [Pneumocystis carinii B80]|uniref:Ribosome biogenesis protein NSA2 homolog n=1 Tax=Pneumocystis carinii (strain B80) TaxID=1408658 RepID=A0A0W4ZLV4_PNEC8|nr:hypothetical protein T552_01302 [Pneumocystis carinii B80]KTW29347.1 hypothetical protein T552_01302 [Pneumocystis carinii B80]